MIPGLTVICGDAVERLRELAGESVQCCVSSPPYWGLRDYGTASWEGGDDGCDHLGEPFRTKAKLNENWGEGYSDVKNGEGRQPFKDNCGKCGAKRIDSQLGLEKTPEKYVARMVEVFREVRRVLRNDGVCWINLGDSYTSDGRETRDPGQSVLHPAQPKGTKRADTPPGLKPKDLCGIPWRVAFALQADGWYLRSDVIEEVEFYCPCGCGYVMEERIWRYSQDRELIWRKPNPMPESTRDRPTKSHEYLFLLTKSARYFYDAEAIKERGIIPEGTLGAKGSEERFGMNGVNARPPEYKVYDGTRNKRSVWTVATAPYPEAHFATYPPDLIKPCILAGTSARGCCAKCGAPWERITEKVAIEGATQKMPDGMMRGKGAHGTIHPNGREKGETGLPVFTEKTLGWQPTCDCSLIHSDNDPSLLSTKPCTVLDPFAGSGTTGQVALELGRSAILIELNPKYIRMIEKRCTVTLGLAF